MVSRETLENLANIGVFEGRGFISEEFFDNVSKDEGSDTINMIIENPSGSGIYVALDAPIITADRSVEYEMHKNVTKDVAGTSVPTVNQRTDGSDTSVASVEHTVEWTGGTSFGREQSPGGGFIETGFSIQDNSILIAPGDNILFEGINVSAATIDIALQFSYVETLEKNIPPTWSP